MDTEAVGRARTSPTSARPAAALPPRRPARRGRTPLWADLTVLGVVGALLVGAAVAGAGALYREFYSPTAFVERYLGLLADGRAAEALAVPGVRVESAELEAAGLPPNAHDALLRRDAMANLGDVRIVSEVADGDIVRVTVGYMAGEFPGVSTFDVARQGWAGIAPTWRFATSPLAVLELSVAGSREFDVNGFRIDQRQVSPEGADADALAPVDLLVFSPGIYSVSVDTTFSATPGVAVLSDSPFTAVPVRVDAVPTEEFVSKVQTEVEGFLTACATQDVLQPTACPFGYVVEDRIVSPPAWSIVQQPTVALVPTGEGWAIAPAAATAHIEVEIRSLFDGSITEVSEDVPFELTGTVTVLPDNTVSIRVG